MEWMVNLMVNLYEIILTCFSRQIAIAKTNSGNDGKTKPNHYHQWAAVPSFKANIAFFPGYLLSFDMSERTKPKCLINGRPVCTQCTRIPFLPTLLKLVSGCRWINWKRDFYCATQCVCVTEGMIMHTKLVHGFAKLIFLALIAHNVTHNIWYS